ncbi:hypothetical protein NTE_01880 [Candidatus Nitrososphaera evergladensis SR1]|uniref:Uncharacterized protein n=1 Tax=Candidatus Nitrososphaera evergladensis SR1 TaxID=1459636 RepID=A0A075MXB0_9ARCH|nr:hypothetical protein NTE_01880 [Candidatus Nitrososphaera evergladensis SR1]
MARTEGVWDGSWQKWHTCHTCHGRLGLQPAFIPQEIISEDGQCMPQNSCRMRVGQAILLLYVSAKSVVIILCKVYSHDSS